MMLDEVRRYYGIVSAHAVLGARARQRFLFAATLPVNRSHPSSLIFYPPSFNPLSFVLPLASHVPVRQSCHIDA